MNEFSHIISLGSRCYTAMDLSSLDLRDTSSPFDWLVSDWYGVERALKSDFADFLLYENMSQCKQHRGWYCDENYHFEYRHDFTPFRSLKSQLNRISNKYQRRIKRFRKNICDPTLFVRYIETETELKYITDHYSSILTLIKRSQSDNEIVFVSHLPGVSKINDGFYVQTESSYSVHPIQDCTELREYLCSFPYEKKNENARFRLQKKNQYHPKLMKHSLRWQKMKMKYFPKYTHRKQYTAFLIE